MLTDAQRTALAARLRHNRRSAPPSAAGPIVALGTRGAAAAVAVHAVGGSVHEYAPLARALDGTCRLSGIEAAGLRAGSTPVASLAAMADRYAGLVRAAQPDGPYRLVGWSMGGVLAYEVGRRLEAAGERVCLIVLIDAPYRTVPSYADTEEGLAALFVADALRGAGLSTDGLSGAGLSGAGLAGAGLAGEPVAAQLAHLAARLAPDPGEREAIAAELARRHAVFVAHTTALAGYEPDGPVDAAGVLVTADGSKDSAQYWRMLFRGGTSELRVPADHYGCLRPPAVEAIAAQLIKEIDR